MQRRPYEPLDRAGSAVEAASSERPGPNRVSREFVNRVSTKVQAALWVIGMGALFLYGGVGEALFDPNRSSPGFVYTGLAALSVAVVVMLYCVVYIRRILRNDFPWQVVAPGMIETATAAGVVSFVSFIAGLWPAYGFLTPLVVTVIYMGFTFSTHFLPPIF